MKHVLLTTIAAVVLVGCGNSDGALIQAAKDGDIEAVKQHLAAGANVNAKEGGLERLLCILRLLTITRNSPNCLSRKVRM